MAQRRELKFNCIADVIADVRKLRDGYEQAGQWSLPQMCYHLNKTVGAAMKPGPFLPDTAEQVANKVRVRDVLASGKIPSGIVAPPDNAPPESVPDSVVDDFLVTLTRFDNYNNPLAPHWRFGLMGDGDRRRHQLIHCAHHLSHLVPAKIAGTQAAPASTSTATVSTLSNPH